MVVKHEINKNWTFSLDIKNKHTLIEDGIYKHIRHPMYAAHLLWGIAQVLLVPNWIAGFASLVVFIPFYFLRVRREERVMLEQFGEEYRLYRGRTGRLLPRFHMK